MDWRKRFWATVAIGFFLGLIAAPNVCAQEHYVGLITISDITFSQQKLIVGLLALIAGGMLCFENWKRPPA